jgi:hypothetical protein
MTRVSILAFAMVLTAATSGASMKPAVATVTLTGWFSDKGCAEAKMSSEDITPNGTVCVRKCLDEGAAPVFVDPKGRAMYEVKDHPSVRDDVGYYVELTGLVDAEAKTIAVRSVKRIGDVIQMCGRKPKKS